MNRPTTPAVTPPVRRAILAAAFGIGLALALVPHVDEVGAQQTPPPAAPEKPAAPPKSITISAEPSGGAKIELKGSVDVKPDAASGPAPEARDAPAAGATRPGSGGHNITIGKDGRVRVNGLGTDREFDSFEAMVHDQPAIAAMVVLIVSVVFLAPVLLIAVILWYRFRKARLMNETMVKLAEKGIVPSPEALDALASGSRGSRVTIIRDTGRGAGPEGAAAAAPVTETTTQIVVGSGGRWSDLRKGVIMGGIGLALMLYSLFEDREPNAVGLILFFVGLGFVALWWFETRQRAAAAGGALRGSPPAA